ncbi:hypothetical protein BJ166DRAFT_50503 [Pestalotiopsis sp. NC0098]|nr:hypothetical protein BJ166DRAFT_50503 [Pestalotiopsis sp. NC0098]
MTAQVKPGPRSPESRSNRYSFFEEVDDVAMKTYSPDQISTILQQRENLQNVLAIEDRSKSTRKRSVYFPRSGTMRSIYLPPGLAESRAGKPWVPEDLKECQFKCCHRCRPTCEPRSYLSLDGVVKGDIPASAAVGFGFHQHGSRPVMDAEVVKNIGYRPVPLPRSFQRDPETPSSPSSSLREVIETIDQHVIEDEPQENDNPSQNVAQGIKHARNASNASNGVLDLHPVPTPAIAEVEEVEDCSKDSAKQFSGGRKIDLETCGASNGFASEEKSSRVQPYQLYSMLDVDGPTGYHPRSNKSSFDKHLDEIILNHACDIPLPAPTPHEETFLRESLTLMEEQEIEEGRFHDTPLEVADGFAILEESVEMHVPDVITQF